MGISIHALLAESDSAWVKLRAFRSYFYPRSPCGERRQDSVSGPRLYCISIHALLAESDGAPGRDPGEHTAFLSTLSLRRATLGRSRFICPHSNFYPRSPCGERQALLADLYLYGTYFYPRSPCGERRRCGCLCGPHGRISIHALLAESDDFAARDRDGKLKFLSTLSLRRATAARWPWQRWQLNFYPRSPCGERRASERRKRHERDFYPRSPCGERPRTQSASLSA